MSLVFMLFDLLDLVAVGTQELIVVCMARDYSLVYSHKTTLAPFALGISTTIDMINAKSAIVAEAAADAFRAENGKGPLAQSCLVGGFVELAVDSIYIRSPAQFPI